MANWCSTVYVFYGENKEGIDNLFKDLKEVEEKDNTWIGNVFMKKGFTEKEAEELVYRSFITSVCRYKTGEVELTCEDAWNYHYEAMSELIDKYGEGIHFEMLAEECGNGIFVNTDEGGVYFTDRFMIDCDIDGNCFNEYFANEEGLREYVSKMLKVELNDNVDISEMSLDAIQDYFNSKYEDDGCSLYINEFDTEI